MHPAPLANAGIPAIPAGHPGVKRAALKHRFGDSGEGRGGGPVAGTGGNKEKAIAPCIN